MIGELLGFANLGQSFRANLLFSGYLRVCASVGLYGRAGGFTQRGCELLYLKHKFGKYKFHQRYEG